MYWHSIASSYRISKQHFIVEVKTLPVLPLNVLALDDIIQAAGNQQNHIGVVLLEHERCLGASLLRREDYRFKYDLDVRPRA